MAQDFAAPICMTFKQALGLDEHIRKGEKGLLVVCADGFTLEEIDEKTDDFSQFGRPFRFIDRGLQI